MKLKTTSQKAAEAAAQYLEPGEQITVTGFGELGRVTILRQFTTMLVSEILTLGLVRRTVRARRVHYILTNKRLFALDGESFLYGPGQMRLNLPLKAMKVISSKKTLFDRQNIDLAVDGQPKPLRISFGASALKPTAGEQIVAAIETIGGGRVAPQIPAAPAGYGQAQHGAPQAYAPPPPGYGQSQAWAQQPPQYAPQPPQYPQQQPQYPQQPPQYAQPQRARPQQYQQPAPPWGQQPPQQPWSSQPPVR